ncbi:MAG: hypothetical protein LIP04_16455 [Tannerellaceae bacterium]|nr:hypothetical protein [Tannerellaceae bacterium]
MKFLYIAITILLVSVQSVMSQTPEQLKSYLPSIAGWTIADKTEVFDAENLFDRINGAAPLYIENNFVEMTSMEYQKEDAYITIQVYRHATPEDAFGMYASERTSELTFYPIGGEAQGDGKNLFFFAGDFYVKIRSNASEDVDQTLQEIAGALARQIDPNASYPPIVKAFPATGLQPYSVAYTTANYIGHEFLQCVYTAKYDREGQPVQAFIIDGKTVEGAKEVLNKYFTFTKQPLDYQEGPLEIKDRYNGDMPAIWKGRYIIGIFNEHGDPVPDPEPLLQDIAGNL